MSAGKQIDPTDLVDHELRPGLEYALKLVPESVGEVTPERLAPIRRSGLATSKPLLATPQVEERTISSGTDAPSVKVYVINADASRKRPAILHMHGGGFFLGSALSSVADMQAAALALDCVVVTVDYRLAPETPFPGALEDNYTALGWICANAESLGVDPERIALQGESAGGGHAAMLAIAVRDRGEFPICLQVLLQPMLDDRTGSSHHPPAHIGALLWRSEFNVAGWRALLGSEPGGATAPKGSVPAREQNLAGLPATFIAVGSIDLFIEEDIEYAKRLCQAGVPTELLILPGAFHGFDAVGPFTRIARQYRLAYFNALARAFGRSEFASAPDPAPAGTRAVPQSS